MFSKRSLSEKVVQTLDSRPLVYLNGARQVGKSTLCAHLDMDCKINRMTFDSPLLLNAARNNPREFVGGLPADALNVIDEVQFAPEIFPYLKMRVDESRLNGKNNRLFLLTGSANLMALPVLSDALVGRMAVLSLYPFSAAEYYGAKATDWFSDDFLTAEYPESDVLDAVRHATFPEIALNGEIDRMAWFDDYLTTILNRDVKALSDLKNPDRMVTLLSLLAMRAGGLLNMAAMAAETGADVKTVEKMAAFAVNSFMVFQVRPWATPNKLNKRFVKSPKLYFTDTNFLAYLLKCDLKTLYDDKMAWGHVFENFVAGELVKQASLNRWELSHFRTQTGKEVDFVLENGGDVVGIEVKSSASVDKKYLSGLRELKELTGDRFKQGIVLYAGNAVVPLDDRIFAVPVGRLWA